MSLYDYQCSKRPLYNGAEMSFYGLIMAAMRAADTDNLEKLKKTFPDTYSELYARYTSPGGILPHEMVR
jgi:hypothetical protein